MRATLPLVLAGYYFLAVASAPQNPQLPGLLQSPLVGALFKRVVNDLQSVRTSIFQNPIGAKAIVTPPGGLRPRTSERPNQTPNTPPSNGPNGQSTPTAPPPILPNGTPPSSSPTPEEIALAENLAWQEQFEAEMKKSAENAPENGQPPIIPLTNPQESSSPGQLSSTTPQTRKIFGAPCRGGADLDGTCRSGFD